MNILFFYLPHSIITDISLTKQVCSAIKDRIKTQACPLLKREEKEGYPLFFFSTYPL